MFESISYFQVLGIPLIIYLGVAAVVFFVITAVMMMIPKKKSKEIFSWHRYVAFFALVVGVIHAILGISAYF